MNDTTQRIATTPTLDAIRNVNNRIAILSARRANQTHSTADREELDRLHKKLDRLNQEYDEGRRLLEARQRAAADRDPAMQRARANTIRH